MVVSVLAERSNSLVVLPLVSRAGKLTLPLSATELRRRAFVSYDFITTMPAKAFIRRIGHASQATMEQTNELLSELVGLKESRLNAKCDAKRGEIYELHPDSHVLIVSSPAYSAVAPTDVIGLPVGRAADFAAIRIECENLGDQTDWFAVPDVIFTLSVSKLGHRMCELRKSCWAALNPAIQRLLGLSDHPN
jgi:mRNA-degrading endonuclease toxin of MazEF toxin-antitoxin module